MRVALICLFASLAAADPLIVPPRVVVPGDDAPAASPSGYPDEAGLLLRRNLVVRVLAQEDLERWRRGYFKSGDPGKFLPGAALAKLLADPDAADAMRYLTDDRSSTEHYHFAALNWARMWPLLKDRFPAEFRLRFEAAAARSGDYLGGQGTENHRTMAGCAGLVLADWVDNPRLSGTGRDDLRTRRIAWLKRFVRGNYQAGNGEWDSSTYLGFTINGLLCVYDFSKDESARRWARAGLEALVAGYALKYSDGVFCAPSQRGSAATPGHAITDQVGWAWWGATEPSARSATTAFVDFRYSMHAFTSAWRPGRTLDRIARKQVPMPVEQYNTKGNYWLGHELEPVPGAWYESVTLHPGLTMGALWKGFGGQTTRFQAVATGGNGAVTLFAGSPLGRSDGDGSLQVNKWQDGGGMFDQTALVGTTLIQTSRFPVSASQALAHVTIPPGTTPERHGAWWMTPLGSAWIGVQGIGHPGDLTTSAAVSVGTVDPKKPVVPLLVFPGFQVGFVLVGIPPAEVASQNAAALAAELDRRCPVLAEGEHVLTKTWDGRELLYTRVARNARGEGTPTMAVNGSPILWTDAQVYGGPLVTLRAGVLSVWDGSEGYRVDVTGEDPVWKALKP